MDPKKNNWRLDISFITSDCESAFPSKDDNRFERSFERAVEAEGIKAPFTVPSISNHIPSRSSLNLQLPLPHGILSQATWTATQHVPSQKPPGAAESSLEALCHSTVPSAMDHATGITIDSTATIPSYDRSYHSMMPTGSYYHSLSTGLFSGKESLERRSRSQERNRLAAMKSRQRKKKEWERLIHSESLLREENAQLKREVARLREQLNFTNCNGVAIAARSGPEITWGPRKGPRWEMVTKAALRSICLALQRSGRRSYSEASAYTENIRNVAIIAHVDHGKTSLVDCLLRHSGAIDGAARGSRVMDSNSLEKERGITILAKCTSLSYKDHRINIVDTPGHADFGGEVERALTMVDGVVLVVDATEGPMAQTKFVLSKALERNLRPIVVQNKVDRESARCDEVDCEVLDLFMSLNCTDEQLEYPTIYASARDDWAFPYNPFSPKGGFRPDQKIAGDMRCLLDTIATRIPAPSVKTSMPFSLLVNSVETNAFVGRCVLGRVQTGSISIGDKIKAISSEGVTQEEGKVTLMFVRQGLQQVELSRAVAGDIVSIAGLQTPIANVTVCSPEVLAPLEAIPIDPPTVAMTFMANNSPIAGAEGKSFTRKSLEERLRSECENNLSLKISPCADNTDAFQVSGRGEMQLGVLIETIRREGYEIAVSPPQVLYKEEGGLRLEPIEEIVIDCDNEFSGGVIEKLSKRRAELTKMIEGSGQKCRMFFKGPTRGLIGFLSELKNDTKGTGVMNSSLIGYEAYKGPIESSRKGSLISTCGGSTTGYAIVDLESRGELFLSPGTVVYAGMILGECSRAQDLEVNPCRSKALTNVRSTVKEEFFRLRPPRLMTLEEMIAYMAEDEILEVTPSNIRLRKADLDPNVRKRRAQSKKALAN